MTKPKKWSPIEDQNLINMINKNMHWRDIANALGVTSWQAERRSKALNLGHKNPFTYNSVNVTVSIPEKLDNALYEAARKEGLSKSFYVRKLLEKHLHVTYSS